MALIQTQTSSDGKQVTFFLKGRVDFMCHKAFREAYLPYKGPAVEFRVDFRGVEMMDSAGLGILLQLREHAGGETSRVCLMNCKPGIAKILEIANFHHLFTIEKASG